MDEGGTHCRQVGLGWEGRQDEWKQEVNQCFTSCLQVAGLGFCSDFSQWRTVNSSQIKTSLPKILQVSVLPQKQEANLDREVENYLCLNKHHITYEIKLNIQMENTAQKWFPEKLFHEFACFFFMGNENILFLSKFWLSEFRT